jgi:hypothetical protein
MTETVEQGRTPGAHWMLVTEPDLEPYGVVCRCDLGHDHDDDENDLGATRVVQRRETGA